MSKYFSNLVQQSLSRTTEATLSILSIADPDLREHLGGLMRAECGSEGSFLAPPLFEQTFGWEEAGYTMSQLAEKGGLLSKEIVSSLDSKENGRYRFGADWKPFTHQLSSWKSLLEKKNSVVVTSGTGSGKTECFMVPILEDLHQEYLELNKQPLVGVRALFLYPLNALINSQRERLNAWTQSFGSGIRYCLYNGNTEQLKSLVRTKQKEYPNEIFSRELMREEPAPILVTNGTMLEYMMVRQVDAPIVKISRQQKSLRWIVLDEAHTYIGSQAAELALQLRRVMNAFGVTPANIRFVATSATIAGEGAKDQLKQFLSDLSGVPTSQIDVLDGQRIVPELEVCSGHSCSLDELENSSKENGQNTEVNLERYQTLVHSPIAREIRSLLVGSKKPLKVTEICEHLYRTQNQSFSQEEVLRWLDICSGTRPDEDAPAFLKLRAHFFQRTTHGLWSCIDNSCSAKHGTPLQEKWPFGYVYVNQRHKCECGSPVFELSFCNNCNEPHLLARDRNGKLVQWESSIDDEFSLQVEAPDEADEKTEVSESLSPTASLVIACPKNTSTTYIPTTIDKLSGSFSDIGDSGIEILLNETQPECVNSSCGYKGFSGASPFRRAMLGGPFYIANAVPTVLEYCQDFASDEETQVSYGPQSLPGRGRRLITFTDSRQGTARMAVRMQQEAERNRLRGYVVDILSSNQRNSSIANSDYSKLTPEVLHKLIAKELDNLKLYREVDLREDAQVAESKITKFKAQLEAGDNETASVKLAEMKWSQLTKELQEKTDVSGSMLLANKYQKPDVFNESDGSYKLAELLLFREFMRRPKRQNNLETQGLVKVGYSGLDGIQKAPDFWESKGLTLQDWRDFIKVALDFHIRENSFIQIADGWKSWIGNRFSAKELRNPASKEPEEARIKRWPQVRNGNYQQRLIKLLIIGANLNPKRTDDVDLINIWLKSAWHQLTSLAVLKGDDNRFHLPRESILFSLVSIGFACPVTNKILDTTFKGLTPYLPANIDFSKLTDEQRKSFICEQVDMPKVWEFDRSQDDYLDGLNKVRCLVAENIAINSLRERNLWTDINDRAVEGGFYYRAVEHSAQQSATVLQKYEDMFKKGKVNVMNCSTTMEMGVDIGGISAVVMNNVPPHPANYLQRAGRAGRSKESRALAYTLCKNNPHDQQVFADPAWPFETKIPAPAVALNSARLVQRHVNSLLLSEFLCNISGTTQTEKTSLNTQWFYGDETGESQCNKFVNWLSLSVLSIDDALVCLTKGTALTGVAPDQLRRRAMLGLQKLQKRWLDNYHYLLTEEKQAKTNSPYLKRLQVEKARHCKEYLLRDLAARTFLPGYGFPTDVVNFDNFTMEDYRNAKVFDKTVNDGREDNVSHYKGLPSRNLAIAIREYAPGAEIVLDGRVFRSAGVSLHWHNLAAGSKEEQKVDTAWRCEQCGEHGYEEEISKLNELVCPNNTCGALIKQEHKRQVLQPSGFVTDAYENATNDIQFQKFIPIEKPWVFVRADKTPLPNPELGVMSYGSEGEVFHHSLGENGAGFALCMSCGRAESMLDKDEFPKTLSTAKEHFSPRPSKGDKDQLGKRLPCPGSAKIMPNITLGARAQTDVFELVLRNPENGEYITASSTALTLAVALRYALAEILGVSAAELGYATRPSKMTNGGTAWVIQLFDVISGGAGFASSAPLYIERLLKSMVDKLSCSVCETSCSECLLDSETRHDHASLDRKTALEWLGDDFVNHTGLSDEDKLALNDGCYAPGSIEHVLRRHINTGAEKLTLFVAGDIADWDMQAPQFRRALHNYALVDSLNVELIVPAGITDEDILQDLRELSILGVRIGLLKSTVNKNVVAQVSKGKTLHTLASNSIQAITPSVLWHQSDALVVESLEEALISCEQIQISIPEQEKYKAVDLAIQDELNGSLQTFGERFLKLISEKVPAVKEELKVGAITKLAYSDRYIQNPAVITILGSLLYSLRGNLTKDCCVEILTLFKSKAFPGKKAFDDWVVESDFTSFSEAWLSLMVGKDVEFVLAESNRNIPHHRRLEIEFASGEKLKVRFDQGVAYWRVRYASHRDMWFDFDLSFEEQMQEMANVIDTAIVQNSEQQWATDVLVEFNEG